MGYKACTSYMQLLLPYYHNTSTSLVVEALKRGEPGINSKRVDFGIIRKKKNCTITYSKSSQILFGETF